MVPNTLHYFVPETVGPQGLVIDHGRALPAGGDVHGGGGGADGHLSHLVSRRAARVRAGEVELRGGRPTDGK